ncbi:DDE superfamily endonuclease [Popillia japonica]|uniref:DDE superfamily endonuclease n=1 Tax=Popillia japonica TaxID=7064 RepID=A0AAW1ISJ6_POPJA
MQPRLLDGSLPGTQGRCTPNGWTSGEVFLNWIHFFIEQVRPTTNKKVQLLLDNHESHKYYPALEYATKNNVLILSLAPHTTYKMQPMDVAIYGPLKTHFESAVNIFQKSHPGRIIKQYDVSRLPWPVNRHAFGDEHFAPTEVLAGTSNLNAQTETCPHCKEWIYLSPLFHHKPYSRIRDSEILEFINPLPVSSSDKVLGWPQFPNEYRPCTPTESGTIKETQDNDVPVALSKPGCSKTYYSPSVLKPIPQPAKPTTTWNTTEVTKIYNTDKYSSERRAETEI